MESLPRINYFNITMHSQNCKKPSFIFSSFWANVDIYVNHPSTSSEGKAHYSSQNNVVYYFLSPSMLHLVTLVEMLQLEEELLFSYFLSNINLYG